MLNITLLDLRQHEADRCVIYQRAYNAEEPLKEMGAQALAEAMSRAMQKLSKEIISEIYDAAKKESQ